MPLISNIDKSIDYFGELSWANLLDWLITFCLGAILALTALQLGGVRPETQLLLMPLYAVLLVLHGLYLAVAKDEARKLNPVPLFFIPFLLWAAVSAAYLTPTPWRGSAELGYFFSAFLFGWVATNNARTRAHLWALVFIALIPVGQAIFIGYYQFFQDPSQMADVSLDYPVVLSPEYRGQATGLFADPGSFAAFLLLLLPAFTIAAFVPRLPKILRVLSFYVSLILVIGIALAQIYWAAVLVVVMMTIVPWFCFEKRSRRYVFSFLGAGSALLVFLAMYFFNPLFQRGLLRALSPEGEGIRLVLWKEVLNIISANPFLGVGAGSFSYWAEMSPDLVLSKVPLTPHSDLLLILNGYGLLGACLLFLPPVYVLVKALRQWGNQPFKIKRAEGALMSTQKFFLSIAIGSCLALCFCSALHFISYVPALMLYGVLMFSILAKSSFRRSVSLPGFRYAGCLYLVVFSLCGLLFWSKASLVLESQGLELQAQQRLETLVERGVSVSGNEALVDKVIEVYEDALIANPGNADAWIGLSMAICQLHYRDPADFRRTGARAVDAAARAYEIAPDYWLASAQLGVAHALAGQTDEAHSALLRAIELAPNASNAHYYYAAFLSTDPLSRDEAIQSVNRALEINPANAVARRLKQKLLIL